ncbi:MAG: hypothetical protein HY288_03900 [Planctomycetia bacterium]|nr:hypothetical protein [Planctomycetia bacterium]
MRNRTNGCIEQLESRVLLAVDSLGSQPTAVAQAAMTADPVTSTITMLSPIANAETNSTAKNPQSKSWLHGNQWWSMVETSGGTSAYRLDGSSWTPVLQISGTTYNADVKPVGNGDITYVFLYHGTSSKLAKLTYVNGTYELTPLVSPSTPLASITLSTGSQTGTLDIDSTGRMWVASVATTAIEVRYADAPYTSWSAPIAIASFTSPTAEINAVVAFSGKIGVMWTNHAAQRFGFRYHVDGADPTVFSPDEVPASQSAQNVGSGMADNHVHLAVSSNGTLYAAVKTAYDAHTQAAPEMALLVRRTSGVWDPLYGIDGHGTRPILDIDNTVEFLRFMYAGDTNVNDIVYKDIPLSAIDPNQPNKFYSGPDVSNSQYPRQTLISGGMSKNIASTKESFDGQLVAIATNASDVLGNGPYTITGAKMVDTPLVANQPPVISLNGDVSPSFTVTWSGSAVNIESTANTSAGATITDANNANLTSLTISLNSPNTGDVLSANTAGTGIAAAPFDGTNLVLSGGDTLANYQTVLRTVQYNNLSGGPGIASETATFTAVDPFGATGTATSTINIQSSTVVGRLLFYAGSTRYDTTGNPQTPLLFSDDNAIAADKIAYVPNGTAATFANVSSYDKGINGIMVDLLGIGTHTSITLANIQNDFTFKVGNNNSPNLWSAAPLPSTVLVRTGAGVSGSDRVELIWADGAITQQWLELIVKATTHTGLAANDVFFFGNEIGDTGASNTATVAKVTSLDVTGAQTHGASSKTNIPITDLYDFSRDGLVNSLDVTDAQIHGTTLKTGLQLINVGAGGPFAPASTGGGDVGVTSALASAATNPTTPTIPPWIVKLLAHRGVNRIDLKSNPIVKYFEQLAREDTLKSGVILVKADQVADSLNLDDPLLDSLLAKLGVVD